jgi:hypothetical protein
MYEATKHFIEARQSFCKWPLEYIESVERVNGGTATECFDNALNLFRTMRGSMLVSGWVVNKYDADNKLTAILQHWWVKDATGKSYDSTPYMTDEYQYVQDMEIYTYGEKNLSKIQNRVTMNLMFKDNTYWLIEQVEPEFLAKPIKNLKTSVFFRRKILKRR